jgi:hypothetical protein
VGVVSVHLSIILQTYQRSPLRDKGAMLIMEQQNKRLIQLRNDLIELHCIQESATADIAGIEEDELRSDTVLDIKTIGEGLEARYSLGRFPVCYRDVIEKNCKLGIDERYFKRNWMTNLTMERFT